MPPIEHRSDKLCNYNIARSKRPGRALAFANTDKHYKLQKSVWTSFRVCWCIMFGDGSPWLWCLMPCDLRVSVKEDICNVSCRCLVMLRFWKLQFAPTPKCLSTVWLHCLITKCFVINFSLVIKSNLNNKNSKLQNY